MREKLRILVARGIFVLVLVLYRSYFFSSFMLNLDQPNPTLVQMRNSKYLRSYGLVSLNYVRDRFGSLNDRKSN